MSRTIRLLLAAVAVSTVVAPALPASAEPDPPRPPCRLYFTDEDWIAFSEPLPVPFPHVGRPYWVC